MLFITGYAENAVLSHGHVAHGMEMLTKPFAVDALIERVLFPASASWKADTPLEGFAKRMPGLCAERRGATTAAQELAMETSEARTKCPNCGNDVVIERNWTRGGFNDSGGYVLQCEKCDHIFAFHLGKDVNDSRVLSGAKRLDTYDDEVGNKDEVLGKYGL